MLKYDRPLAQQDVLVGGASDTGNLQNQLVKAMALQEDDAAAAVPKCEGVPQQTTDGAYLHDALSAYAKEGRRERRRRRLLRKQAQGSA